MTVEAGARCDAHGTADCPACSRIMVADVDNEHGGCRGCHAYHEIGMHAESCACRVVGGAATSRPVSAFAETPEPREPGEIRPLTQPRRKAMLIRKLAAGMSNAAACAQFQVTKQAISYFRDVYKTEIADVRKNLADEFAGLWSAEKYGRIAALQEQIERAERQIMAAERTLTDEDGEPVEVTSAREWVAELRALLRAVAEELGQIPNKSSVDVGGAVQLNYTIEGVDLAALT
jgi:hypothetical protein